MEAVEAAAEVAMVSGPPREEGAAALVGAGADGWVAAGLPSCFCPVAAALLLEAVAADSPVPALNWPWVLLLLLVIMLSAGVWWWIAQIHITTGKLGVIFRLNRPPWWDGRARLWRSRAAGLIFVIAHNPLHLLRCADAEQS